MTPIARRLCVAASLLGLTGAFAGPAAAAATKPAITGISPASGLPAGGNSVTLTGTHFNGATAVVFDKTPAADVAVTSDTRITATVPAHKAGRVAVKVTSPAGTSANNATTKYLYQAAPTIKKLSKNSGSTAGGLALTIQGTNLAGVSAAMFGDVPGTIIPSNSSSSITVTVPPHQPGTVDLAVRTPSGTSPAARFTYFGLGNAPTTWRAVAAGGKHSCGLRTDNTLWCWGDNTHGQLGTGDTDNRATPTPIGMAHWQSVVAGQSHTCGLRTDKTLWCWGDNAHGQLGTGDTNDRATPRQVGGDTWIMVATSATHTCGIQTDNTLWCWGDNATGQLGTGDSTDHATEPSRVDDAEWTSVSAGGADQGDGHSCGIHADGSLWCWGSNASGELGLGYASPQEWTPVLVGDQTWKSTTSGLGHTCGIRTDDTLACWGQNAKVELGLDDTEDRSVPTNVGMDTWKSVTAEGDHHTCGIRTNDTLWCWGDNADGRLGIGAAGQQEQPAAVGSLAPSVRPMSTSEPVSDQIEDWSDLDHVDATGVTTSGNRVFSTGSSGEHGYVKPIDFPEHGTWSFQQVLYLEGGSVSPAPTIKVGVSFGDPAKGFSNSDPDAFGWQLKNSTRARSVFKGDNLLFLPIQNQVVSGPSLGTTTGKYLFTIDADEHFISFGLKRADLAAELASFKIKRSDLVKAGKTITELYASINDKRGEQGSSLSPFVYQTGSLQPDPSTATVAGQTIAGTAQHVISTGLDDDSPMGWYVALPPGDLAHAPLVIDLPQSLTGDGDDAWTEARMASIIDALTKAGFMFASSTDTKDRFGNQVELDNYKALNDYVMEHFGADRDVFTFGTSMGSLGAISLVAKGMIDAKAVATVGFAGGFDNLWNTLAGSKRPDIRDAYGFKGSPPLDQRRTYTAGYDPLLSFVGDPEFAGRAFRFYTGTADTTTPPALSHTMSGIVRAAGASASTVVVGDGGHLSSAQFQGDDLVAFYRRNLTILPAPQGVSRWAVITTGGDGHTCGIQADGSLWCWGDNRDGQLGFDGAATKSSPARVSQ